MNTAGIETNRFRCLLLLSNLSELTNHRSRNREISDGRAIDNPSTSVPKSDKVKRQIEGIIQRIEKPDWPASEAADG